MIPARFEDGGALLADSPVYIERAADVTASRHLVRMDYVTLIEPRQQGKTCLINRLMGLFQPQGYVFAYVDLSTCDKSSERDWYASLCDWLLKRHLRFISRADLPTLPRNGSTWRDFLADVAERAEALSLNLVLALDEVGATPESWATDFFSVIRSIYGSRQSMTCFRHLTFIVAGANNPKELIKDRNISNFNVDHRIPLDDFSLVQVGQLVDHLDLGDRGNTIADRLHFWTGGQPFLCQRLCLYLAERGSLITAHDVDVVVNQFFCEDTSHLPYIKTHLDAEPELFDYARQAVSQKVRFSPSVNDWQFQLSHIIGLISADEEGKCRLRNRIYELAFVSNESERLDMNYERGFQALFSCITEIDSQMPAELATLEDRFRRNQDAERIFGSSESTRSEHAQVIYGLNQLALAYCGASFNDLCKGERPRSTAGHVATRVYSTDTAQQSGQADFAIITALVHEAKAIVSRLNDHEVRRFEAEDIRTYHVGKVPIDRTTKTYTVVVVLLPTMGNLPAANAVSDTLKRWNPRYVLMVGIAGGIPQNDLDLGDVVVADQIVGYDYGKVTEEGIQPRDRVYPASALLLDRVRSFWDDRWSQQIDIPRPSNAKRSSAKLFVGPIASGDKVVASSIFRDQLKSRWSKLLGLEMEGEGVFAATFDRPQIPATLVIRGISDMADERKSDEWQEYAADAAAAFTIAFLRSGPVQPGA